MHHTVRTSMKPRYCFCLGAHMGWQLLFLQLVTLQTLLTILNSTKSTEISNIIKGLSVDTQDTLMKYLYKGMAMPGWGDVSGSVLLGWHEKVRPKCFVYRDWYISCSAVNRGSRSRVHSSNNDRSEDSLTVFCRKIKNTFLIFSDAKSGPRCRLPKSRKSRKVIRMTKVSKESHKHIKHKDQGESLCPSGEAHRQES